jgi:sulfate/thiosulfate transport system substrate-binding protein
MRTARLLPVAAVVAVAALVAAGCGGADDTVGGGGSATASSGKGSTKLSLVAYSAPQVVYDEVIPGFRDTAAGKGVSFSESFGASGDQSRAVESGLAADVVAFSLEPDMTRLVKAGLVSGDWAANAHKGLVSKSVVSLIERKGNPKDIHTWDDLLKPGIEVLTPNPFTSGAAKWNIMAAYGAKSDGGKNPQAGLAYLHELITKHVKVQDKSGREALQDFASGNGDVLISYENEAITALKKGQQVDYVIPDQTILIENPIAVVSKSKHPEQAKAFLDYALSAPAQQKFADWGYRPVDETVLQKNADKFPNPSGLFTIRDLGGWSKINDDFFDPDKGSVAKIEEAAGVSTAK